MANERASADLLSTATRIEVEAEVRYWEDATVNGEEDIVGALIPGRDGDLWRVAIDLAAGRIIDWPAGITADIHYKVCDQGQYWLTDESGQRIAKYRSDYVPDALCHGAKGYGDYIIMKVDTAGFIADYQRPLLEPSQWDRCRRAAA